MFVSDNQINHQVLERLIRRGKSEQLVAAPDSVRNPYYEQGSHPDVVERVWIQLGSLLPMDCKCLIYGTPALIQPSSGVVLAFCLGTAYCIRLVPSLFDEALKLGARTTMKWSGGSITDAAEAFGPDWIFGAWKEEEIKWCLQVYEAFNTQESNS